MKIHASGRIFLCHWVMFSFILLRLPVSVFFYFFCVLYLSCFKVLNLSCEKKYLYDYNLYVVIVKGSKKLLEPLRDRNRYYVQMVPEKSKLDHAKIEMS